MAMKLDAMVSTSDGSHVGLPKPCLQNTRERIEQIQSSARLRSSLNGLSYRWSSFASSALAPAASDHAGKVGQKPFAQLYGNPLFLHMVYVLCSCARSRVGRSIILIEHDTNEAWGILPSSETRNLGRSSICWRQGLYPNVIIWIKRSRSNRFDVRSYRVKVWHHQSYATGREQEFEGDGHVERKPWPRGQWRPSAPQ